MLLAALIERGIDECKQNNSLFALSSWVLFMPRTRLAQFRTPNQTTLEHHDLPNFLSPHFMSDGAIRTLEERPTASDSQGCVDAPFLRKACLK